MATVADNSSWNPVLLYKHLMATADPRVQHLPLVSSPFPHLAVLAVYLLFVALGPRYMRKREAFNLRMPLVFYNFFLVVLSTYMFYEFLMSGWLWKYSLGCEPIDFSWKPENFRIINVGYIFWLSKLIELLDTVFFVLRKKMNQITFLHVFHHTAMPIAWWGGLNWAAGGMGSFHGMINSFVHIVMYTYYGLSAIGPQMQKYLTWKRHLTTFQLIQFIIVFAHSAQLFFIECDYPRVFVWWISSYAFIFFVLFTNFYIRSYTQKASQRAGVIAGDSCAKGGNDKTKNGSISTTANGIKEKNGFYNTQNGNATSDKKAQ